MKKEVQIPDDFSATFIYIMDELIRRSLIIAQDDFAKICFPKETNPRVRLSQIKIKNRNVPKKDRDYIRQILKKQFNINPRYWSDISSEPMFIDNQFPVTMIEESSVEYQKSTNRSNIKTVADLRRIDELKKLVADLEKENAQYRSQLRDKDKLVSILEKENRNLEERLASFEKLSTIRGTKRHPVS